MRQWLRSAASAGHPVLAGQARHDRWIFTSSEADQLAREAPVGRWQVMRNKEPSAGGTASTSSAAAGGSASLAVTDHIEADANCVARTLVNGVPVAAAELGAAVIPDGPGLYAWWHAGELLPGVIHRPSGATRTPDGALELAYVGIANSLSSRLLRDHLGSQTGRSTLRRALGAWIGSSEGWSPEWRAGRPQHDVPSEAALTAWIRTNLFVTWVEHPAPKSVERAVILNLGPPLNHGHNRKHPNWRQLDAARTFWRTSAERDRVPRLSPPRDGSSGIASSRASGNHGQTPATCPTIVAATWLCWRADRVLAVRPHGVEVYFLPGGVPEEGETFAEAAAREVEEEVGIVIDSTDLKEVARVEDAAFGRTDTRVLLVCFEGPGEGHPVPGVKEIAELAWLGEQHWPRFAPAVQKVLAARCHGGLAR